MAYLAELDTNGIPVPGSAFNATVRLDGPVRALHRSADGRRLYVGGEFSRVNGEVRRRLVALDPATGQIDRSFSPLEPSGFVTAIAEQGSRLYIASGGAGGRLLAWAPGGKTTRLWRGSMDGDAMAVASTRDRVYVVGHYDHTVPDPSDPCLDVRDLGDGHFGVSCPDGTPSRHLAAFYAGGEIVDGKNTGKSRIDTEFTAQADTSEGPYAVVVGANNLYVGGNFFRIAASPTDAGGERVKQPGFAVYPAL